MSQRELVFDLLKKVYIDKQYANLLMRRYDSSEITPFVTEVVYGVLRNEMFLTYQWTDLVKSKPRQELVIALNIVVYELYFLDQKTHAVVYEGVNLVPKAQRGFVNAIIRGLINRGFKEDCPLAIRYSIPEWLYRLWIAHYGQEIADKLVKSSNQRQRTYYRINPLLMTEKDRLNQPWHFVSDSVFYTDEHLISSPLYLEGKLFIQDFGAGQIVEELDLNQPYRVLDMCAAPGTKTAQIAIMMGDKGEVFAHDIYPHRVSLINQALKRLRLNSVTAIVQDGLELDTQKTGYYDRVLLDAPCSGLGVLARKPDIKTRIQSTDLDEIVSLQYELLVNAIAYLKQGGILVYSTCTLNKKENEKQIERVLKAYPELTLINEKTIWPFINESDGFYVAKLLKNV